MGLFGLGKKKQQPTDRYAGKPFLLFVDSFVLKAIGKLDAAQESTLAKMIPKLQEVFSSGGDWEDIVMSELDFPSNIRTTIQEMWVKNQEIAIQNNITLAPEQFVEMFVEQNVTNP
jgi:hypothetical protein